MGVIKKLLFRMKKNVVKHLTLSTTSTSATWSPQTVTNSGSTLTWDVSGDITPTSQNVNDPTFDLSANTGTVDMNVYDVSGLTLLDVQFSDITLIDTSMAIALVNFNCIVNQLTSLDFSNNLNLEILSCDNNILTSLNVSNNVLLEQLFCLHNNLTALNISSNIALTSLSCYSNSISSLDLSNNINLIQVDVMINNMSPSATDQIYIDLANGVGINGSLQIRNNRTSASDTARATLVSRGWSFNESYTT